MWHQKGWPACAACLVGITLAASANAQSTGSQAAAEALFEQARDLMAGGRFAEACPKLAESQRLDPAPGTLLNLATCYERNGQIASAWVTYKDAATAAQNADQQERAELARRKAAELAAKLPTLTVVVPGPADRLDLQVTRDREVLGRPGWGVPIPVDPGVHTVEATAPGRRAWRGQASVEGPGSSASIEVPPLEAEPGAEPAQAVGAPASAAPSLLPQTATASPPSTSGSHRSGQRTVGWILGGVGLAGLVGGTVLGAIAKSDNDDANKNCLTNAACSAQGVAANDSAHHAATASTIAFVAGGALAAVGIVVYLTASDGTPNGARLGISPTLASGSGGVTLHGGW